ncbi:NAD(P)H-binding protein [Nguyenibacter vanlangensis]|uniref:NAD(P)H-binding protein n=1 Tax=Nguyenibacter vanlangensis TaxID=1216886 RepID=A0ABZ3D0I2_9PROT
MERQATFLLLGATGGTGQHFIAEALGEGHHVRALVCTPAKLRQQSSGLEVRHGSITDPLDTDDLVKGVDTVVAMPGDVRLRKDALINTDFIRKLLNSRYRAAFQTSYTWKDDFLEALGDPNGRVAKVGALGMRLTLTPAQGHWEASVYIDNLLDSRADTCSFTTFDGSRVLSAKAMSSGTFWSR